MRLAGGLLILVLASTCCAAGTRQAETTDATTVDVRPQTWQVGLRISAAQGPCRNVVAQAPIPMDWPEQSVRMIQTEKSPRVSRVDFKTLADGARLFVVRVPALDAGETAEVIMKIEIAKRPQVAPTDVAGLNAPERPSGSLRPYLIPSPLIESGDRRIRAAAQQAAQGAENDWQRVESIYDWVREKVEYENGPLKGALAALDDGNGDCEELTSLFIAMCRAQRIPARTVWVPGHCYPEFYLRDKEGDGRWYPCQAAGTRQFGSLVETRPILQKGDSFRLPGYREPQRYAQPVATSTNRAGLAGPSIQYVRRRIDDPEAAP